MNGPDEEGWSPVHHCAFRGYIKSLERFVDSEPEVLELQTQDDLASTPFLLAVTSGNLETVECLFRLGAKVDSINSQNHGAVEICAMKQLVSMLQYLLSLDLEKLPVWKNLLKLLGSDIEEEVIAAATCLRTLTDPSAEGINPSWEPFYVNGGVAVISKVTKSPLSEDCKVPVLQLLLNVLEREEVQEQLVATGAIPALVKLLKSPNTYCLQLAAVVMRELARTTSYAESLMQNNAVPALQKAMDGNSDCSVLTALVQAVACLAATGPKQRQAIGATQGCIASVVRLFETAIGHSDLMLALTEAVSSLATDQRDNQNAFVDEGVTQHIVNVILNQTRNKTVQESAVEAIHKLAAGNPHVQHDVLERGAERLLMQLLKKRNAESLQEKTAMALWALAGEDINEKREMANGIGVQTLIDFTNTLSENLHLIGSEGLGCLAQGPLNQQTQIGQSNGVYPLVRLLRSDKEHIVLSVIRSLRYLCVSVGNVPHPKNQHTVHANRGVKLLVALMVHSLSEVIQVEAAFTVACVSLGHSEALEEVHGCPDFSYVRLLRMMYAERAEVRLLAGAALATFAYNNVQQQRLVAEQGGVRFHCFLPFLRSDNPSYRCHAAYQVVVLARIIPDEEQAKSSAIGIKLLLDVLDKSDNDNVKAEAAAFVACLAHTRAGVPSAIVAVHGVEYLCRMLLSKSDHARGSAAIALSYLSLNHSGERHLLHECRLDPYLMQVIKYYTKRNKLSPTFVQGWKHYKKVGLPPIPEGRMSLVRSRPPRDDMRPITNLSVEDTPSGTGQLRGSDSALHSVGEEVERSSRVSHDSPRHSLRPSRLSMHSQRTRASLPELEA